MSTRAGRADGPADDVTITPPTTGADILDTSAAGQTVIRGGVVRAVGYATGVGLSLISAPILIRHLGVVDYGRFLTVSAIVFVVAAVAEAGMTQIGVREFTTREGLRREAFLRNLLALRIVIVLAGTALAVAFTVVVGYDAVLVQGTAISGFGLALLIVAGTFTIGLSARLRLGWMTVVDLVRQVVTVGGIVLLVVLGASLLPFFAVLVAVGASSLALCAWLARHDVPWRLSFDREAWRQILRDTLPFAVATALGVLYFRVTLVLLSLVSTEQETGYFSASFRVVEVLVVVPTLLATSAFPILARAARDDADRLRYALQRLFEVGLLAGVFVGLFLSVGAPFVIGVVGGERFDEAIPVLRIQGAALVGTFLLASWSYGLLALHAHRALLISNGVALLVAMGLTVALAPGLGAEGAAIATTVTELVLAGAYVIALMRARPELRPHLGVAGRVALAAALAVLPAFVPGLPALVAALLSCALFAGLALLLRAVPAELADALPWRRGSEG